MNWQHDKDITRKARKDHQCLLCELIIPKGSIYLCRYGFDSEGRNCMRMHPECDQLVFCKWGVMNLEDEPVDAAEVRDALRLHLVKGHKPEGAGE